MDGAGVDAWSAVADGWAELWSTMADPARRALLDATAVGPGTRVLDVGCGSGELLDAATRRGAVVTGVDPAPGMRALAAARVPDADVRDGDAEHLPFGRGAFDVVLAVNALQFADDLDDALAEVVRVTVPGGLVGVSNWAEGARNDVTVVEDAVARFHDDDPVPDGDLRPAGGLERVLREAGLDVVEAGLVDLTWEVPDDATLVRGILLGEDPDTVAEATPTVLAAASPFRTSSGGYRLSNAFRWAVARTPSDASHAPPPPIPPRS